MCQALREKERESELILRQRKPYGLQSLHGRMDVNLTFESRVLGESGRNFGLAHLYILESALVNYLPTTFCH